MCELREPEREGATLSSSESSVTVPGGPFLRSLTRRRKGVPEHALERRGRQQHERKLGQTFPRRTLNIGARVSAGRAGLKLLNASRSERRVCRKPMEVVLRCTRSHLPIQEGFRRLFATCIVKRFSMSILTASTSVICSSGSTERAFAQREAGSTGVTSPL